MLNEEIDNFVTGLLQTLRSMDRAAVTRSYYAGHNYPTGLRHWDKHLNPNTNPSPASRPRFYTEDAWANELTIRLPKISGISRAVPRPCYPDGTCNADLYVQLESGTEIWSEIKGAWKYDRFRPHDYVANPAFLKHLISITEGVSKDFEKLRKLIGRANTVALVLVIGFDRKTGHPQSIGKNEIAALIQNARLDNTWTSKYDEWEDVHQPTDSVHHGIREGFRVRCWIWWKAMGI